jgi:NADH-quinone oxidoreductase subunit K
MNGDIERYLAVGAVLFVLGALGFLTRRNMIVMFLSAEMMLHGVSLTLVTFGRAHHSFEGQMFTIFILTVAACEAGLALALILALYQKSRSLDIDFWMELREPDLPPPADDVDKSRYVPLAPRQFPKLTPAGLVPEIRDVNDRTLVDDARSPTAEAPIEPPQPQEVIKAAAR